DFDTAIRLDPKNALTYYNRGNAWLRKKDYDKAISDSNEAIRLDQKCEHAYRLRDTARSRKEADALFYLERGNDRFNRRDYVKASQDYNEVIRLDPTEPDNYILPGNAWSSKEDYDKAIQDYNQAIRLDPTKALYFYFRGSAWMEKKDYDKAIKDFNEAIRLDPKCEDAYTGRSTAWSLQIGRRR